MAIYLHIATHTHTHTDIYMDGMESLDWCQAAGSDGNNQRTTGSSRAAIAATTSQPAPAGEAIALLLPDSGTTHSTPAAHRHQHSLQHYFHILSTPIIYGGREGCARVLMHQRQKQAIEFDQVIKTVKR